MEQKSVTPAKSMERWSKPDEKWLKINTDGVFDVQSAKEAG